MADREAAFGSWWENAFASDDNPRRRGMFVEVVIARGQMNPGLWWRLTDGHGDFWQSRPAALTPVDPATSDPETRARVVEGRASLQEAEVFVAGLQAELAREGKLRFETAERLVGSIRRAVRAEERLADAERDRDYARGERDTQTTRLRQQIERFHAEHEHAKLIDYFLGGLAGYHIGNLLEALKIAPSTGDWHGELQLLLEALVREGNIGPLTVNVTAEDQRKALRATLGIDPARVIDVLERLKATPRFTVAGEHMDDYQQWLYAVRDADALAVLRGERPEPAERARDETQPGPLR